MTLKHHCMFFFVFSLTFKVTLSRNWRKYTKNIIGTMCQSILRTRPLSLSTGSISPTAYVVSLKDKDLSGFSILKYDLFTETFREKKKKRLRTEANILYVRHEHIKPMTMTPCQLINMPSREETVAQ